MTDNDITIAEIHRAVMALGRDVREGRIEAREAHERLRIDITDQGLSIRENTIRIEALEQSETKDQTARWAAVGSAIGAAFAAAFAWLHSGGGK